mmetsp:Transcript_495/g.1585  ORF Transcript_495/g.1585 Transcript_495/m.1585 type:complete len:437 (+) Transcript_495:421-1731(+)
MGLHVNSRERHSSRRGLLDSLQIDPRLVRAPRGALFFVKIPVRFHALVAAIHDGVTPAAVPELYPRVVFRALFRSLSLLLRPFRLLLIRRRRDAAPRAVPYLTQSLQPLDVTRFDRDLLRRRVVRRLDRDLVPSSVAQVRPADPPPAVQLAPSRQIFQPNDAAEHLLREFQLPRRDRDDSIFLPVKRYLVLPRHRVETPHGPDLTVERLGARRRQPVHADVSSHDSALLVHVGAQERPRRFHRHRAAAEDHPVRRDVAVPRRLLLRVRAELEQDSHPRDEPARQHARDQRRLRESVRQSRVRARLAQQYRDLQRLAQAVVAVVVVRLDAVRAHCDRGVPGDVSRVYVGARGDEETRALDVVPRSTTWSSKMTRIRAPATTAKRGETCICDSRRSRRLRSASGSGSARAAAMKSPTSFASPAKQYLKKAVTRPVARS